MPFLAVTHLRSVHCPRCGALVAQAGARSFVVDSKTLPLMFDEERLPDAFTVELRCRNGHELRLSIPAQASAEDVAMTPDEAPIGVDARLMEL